MSAKKHQNKQKKQINKETNNNKILIAIYVMQAEKFETPKLNITERRAIPLWLLGVKGGGGGEVSAMNFASLTNNHDIIFS